MWRSIKRWVDWLRNDLIPFRQLMARGHSVHVHYDANGQTHYELPVPWTADAVTVELQIRLPQPARRKTDFTLHFHNSEPLRADGLRPDTSNDVYRVLFRFPTPATTVVGELYWKAHRLAAVQIPVLTSRTFLSGLTLANPSVAARFGGKVVPTRYFALAGCRGLVAAAIVRSPDKLAPIADLGLQVEFHNERTGKTCKVPISLTAEQRATTESLVVAACPRRPRQSGNWSVSWKAGGQELASRQIEGIPTSRFEESICIVDARFAVTDKAGSMKIVRQLPTGPVEMLGPCFLLASSITGAAGLCTLTVLSVTPGEPQPVSLMEQELLVTDAPTIFAPGLFPIADIARIGGFELRLHNRILGTASLSPVPPATLTAEGGFKPPPDFTWTTAAEEELLERLSRLGPEGGRM